MYPIDHNQTVSIAGPELKGFIESIEYLENQKKDISDDIKDVFTAMKDRGFNVKVVREVLKIRKMEGDTHNEFEAECDLYLSALNEG